LVEDIAAEAVRWGDVGAEEFRVALAKAKPPETAGRELILAPEHGLTPKADAARPQAKVILSSAAPCDVSAQFIADRFWNKAEQIGMLYFWQGQFWRWSDLRWSPVDPDTIRAQLYEYLNKAEVRTDRGGVTVASAVYNPKSADVSNVVDALKGTVNIEPEAVTMPGWLGNTVPRPVEDLRELIPCSNGLLDIRTRRLFPHSPRFWSANVLEFAYDPNAKAPRFEQFLAELWPLHDR
jgi:putative DNA primase/helicase